jgi:hypothetical protein
MSEKPSPPFRIAPLRRFTAEPITDPAEQARLDELRKRSAEGRPGLPARGGSSNGIPFAEVLELIDQLPADDQLLLAEHLVVHLPADVLQRLEDQLRARLGSPPQGR